MQSLNIIQATNVNFIPYKVKEHTRKAHGKLHHFDGSCFLARLGSSIQLGITHDQMGIYMFCKKTPYFSLLATNTLNCFGEL